MENVRHPLENPCAGLGIDISPTTCRVMAKRLRDVCTCQKTNRSGAPDAASSSVHWLIFENSPAIYGWVHGSERPKSRQGRKNYSAVPAGLDFMLMTFNPAINGWAIFSNASFTTCRVMAKRLRDV
jgi:hypothetical protein